MPRPRILLLANSPRVRRYFSHLAQGLEGIDASVHAVSVRPNLRPVPRKVFEQIADYGMRRKRARLLPGNPLQLRLHKAIYAVAARAHYWHARLLIERQRPDAIVVWSGNAVDVRAAVMAAAHTGTRCFHFENGFLPGTTQMDLRGVNSDSTVPRDPDFYLRYGGDWPVGAPAQIIPRRPWKGREPVAPLRLPERYVFVPFQVSLDSQVLLHSPWIQRMEDLFETLLAASEAAGPSAPTLVFKEHPNCRRDYRALHERAQRLPRVLFANGNATGELIHRSLGVVTLNSSVGVEALLLGRPVLTLGNAVFAVEGVTTRARSVEAIADWLRRVGEGDAPAMPLRGPFLRYLAEEFLVPDPHQAPGPAHLATVRRKFLQGLAAP